MSPSAASSVHTFGDAAADMLALPKTSPTSEPRLRGPVARPACTHTVMDRVYGNYTCQVCHRVPSVGFIYFCQQDLIYGPLSQLPPSPPVSKAARKKLRKAQNEPSARPWSPATQLDMLGFNKSIVKAAEEGHYTDVQIATLKAQKLNVKQTIQQSLEEREILRSTTGPSPAVLSDKLAALSLQEKSNPHDEAESALSTRKETSRNDTEQKGKAKKAKAIYPLPPTKASLSKAFQSCEFRVCHTCRPLFRDRSFTSFESAYIGESRPLRTWIPELMPVASVSIMKTIGLRTPPPRTPKSPNFSDRSSPSFELSVAESDLESEGGFETPLSDDFAVANDSSSTTIRNSAISDRKSLMQIQKYYCLQSVAMDLDKELEEEEANFGQLNELPESNADDCKQAKIKPQPSSLGFRATLAKDMQDIIERANRDARKAYSRKANAPAQDPLTGIDGNILEKLNALYRKDGKEVFDLDLWKVLTNAILERAARTPLPGEEDDDGLDNPTMKINGLGIVANELHISNDAGGIGVALTEEAAENNSPDIITSV